MFTAKELIVKPIKKSDADAIIKKHHYSGSVCFSQLSFGIFFDGKLMGAIQYGASIDKRRTSGTIGVKMNEYFEINRMALHPICPKNSESRAIAITLRMIRKKYPHIRAILSYADGCQCGDGAIYRAAGFKLISYAKNKTMLTDGKTIMSDKSMNEKIINGKCGSSYYKANGFKPLFGLQYKYVKFFDEKLDKLYPALNIQDVPEALRIYKGKFRVSSKDSVAAGFHSAESGAIPTDTLHLPEE